MKSLQAHTRVSSSLNSHKQPKICTCAPTSVHATSKRLLIVRPGLSEFCSRTPSSICRKVICRYRPDKPEGRPGSDSSQSSSTEAAAYSELAADAAAQAAADELSTADSTPASSHEGAAAAAVAAGSSGALTNSDNSSAAGAEVDSSGHTKDRKHRHGHKHSSKQQKSVAESTPAQKLQVRLEDMTSKYESVDSRLDSLENTLVELLRSVKERSRRPAAAAEVGPAAAAAQGSGSALADGATDADLPDLDEDDEDEDDGSLFDLGKLQTSLSENINRGYLESVKHLREILMAYEWHLHGKELAERKGVAAFEKHCAEHDVDIDFEVLSQLYSNPNDMSVLPNNKLKMLARSFIQQAVDDRYCSIYLECTNTAKELAKTGLKDIIPDSAGKVGGVLKDLLPVPGFLKK